MHPKGSPSENENFLKSILMDETNTLGQKWTWLLLTQNGHMGSILITLANSWLFEYFVSQNIKSWNSNAKTWEEKDATATPATWE